jgi:hypothetical protein
MFVYDSFLAVLLEKWVHPSVHLSWTPDSCINIADGIWQIIYEPGYFLGIYKRLSLCVDSMVTF